MPRRKQVAELAKSKLDPPKRLAELAQRHWGELDGGTRVWDRPSAEVAALKHITLADLRAFFEVGSRRSWLRVTGLQKDDQICSNPEMSRSSCRTVGCTPAASRH